MTIQERLRAAAKSLRVKPMPLSDFIPLLQQAADEIDRLDKTEDEAILDSLVDGIYSGEYGSN